MVAISSNWCATGESLIDGPGPGPIREDDLVRLRAEARAIYTKLFGTNWEKWKPGDSLSNAE